MLNKYNEVLSVEDLCEILGIGRNTAYKILQDNTIPSRRIGRKYIIPKHGVISYLKKYEVLRKKLDLKEALPSDTMILSDNHWAEPRNEVKLNDSLFNNREKR